MILQQITINYSIISFTYKMQSAIIIYMFVLTFSESEKSIFNQIYIINNT